MIADSVSYEGQLERASNADEMLAMAAKYPPTHGGMKMLRQFEAGGDVCSIYELLVKTPDGLLSIPTADWIKVADDRVVHWRVFQDVREVMKRFERYASR